MAQPPGRTHLLPQKMDGGRVIYIVWRRMPPLSYERTEREFRRDTPPGVSDRTAQYRGHLGRGVPTRVSFVDRGGFAGPSPISETVYSVSGSVCWQIYPLSKMDNSGPLNHATCPNLLEIKWFLVTNTIKTGKNLYIFTLSKRLNL